jgi:transketolase
VSAPATYEQALLALATQRDDVVVLTADNRAHVPRVPEFLSPRFIDFGICTQTMVGAAAGLALRGRTPVVHAVATSLTLRAFELIRTDIGIPQLPLKLVGFVPGLLSEVDRPTHQAIDDVAVMRAIPGMQVLCPADLGELVKALPQVVASPAPAYVRYTDAPAAVEHNAPFVIGKAEVLSQEEGVSILTYGPLLREAEQARQVLVARGVPVHLVNMRSLEPVDEQAILDAVGPAELVVTLEDRFGHGGLHTIVAETCLKHRFAPRVLGLHEELSGARVAERILNVLCDREAGA